MLVASIELLSVLSLVYQKGYTLGTGKGKELESEATWFKRTVFNTDWD